MKYNIGDVIKLKLANYDITNTQNEEEYKIALIVDISYPICFHPPVYHICISGLEGKIHFAQEHMMEHLNEI
jgi:hypothetical protein